MNPGFLDMLEDAGDTIVTVDLKTEAALRAMLVLATSDPAGLPAAPS